ncbi:unnamed protein product [Rotaria sp. Silwood1]|nr:unnamed protein product [Rotaria sp. Silwood1]CAF1634451.1 unnamed protein product [Rotaria sp. Silwood1]CAF3756536.1 unnamed protein product [Rotaria sp. Silwood1]CAF3778996.1 unnamed protein product [Rotaria sp. Silwood1]CAF3843727.1 unnamed protein product [Rotaria sp. Silwood1]
MDDFSVKINDLPDEILMTISRKLYNVEVLSSLISVNQRLNIIAHDSNFIDNLTLFQRSSHNFVDPLSSAILDRFLSDILPRIHHRIKWLNLESTSMKNILLATNYPSLSGLSLYGIEVEKAISLFIDKLFDSDYFNCE